MMNRWDNELTKYMKASENRRHTFKMGHIDYSPEVNCWLKRRWLLGRVVRFLKGKTPDPRNLIRDCAANGICDPQKMTLELAEADYFTCQTKIKELKLKAPEMRRRHLKSRLKHAKDREDEESAAAIIPILHKEENRKRWCRVKPTTGTKRGQAVTSVRVKTEGEDELYEKEDGVFGQVSKNLADRFRLSFTAPCCKLGPLFDDIGFLGDTEAAQQILEGTYIFPPGTDPATKLVLEEAAHTYSEMTNEEVST